ncbi:MAG: class I SAM-dependent methyltransferase [Planctomycetaceae bacterium]|nr:class I SAM-dependent methyltransferase [Planctomycetaceae bacterium]
MSRADRPSLALLEQQSAWLAAARGRLLRRARIAARHHVLDLASGPGVVTEELLHRSGGSVVALDSDADAMAALAERLPEVTCICSPAENLPFADATFDLVYCQFAMMWLDVEAAVREVRRILAPGGVFTAIEPDYGGMIEHPYEIASRDLWLAALSRGGADPCVGRRLPAILSAAGFEVRVDLLDQLMPPSPARFDLLGQLPLIADERASLERIRQIDASLSDASRVVHLPMFLIMGDVL